MRFGHPRLRIQQFASGAIWKLFLLNKALEALSIFALLIGSEHGEAKYFSSQKK